MFVPPDAHKLKLSKESIKLRIFTLSEFTLVLFKKLLLNNYVE